MVAAAVQYAHGTDYVFLSNKAGDGSDGSLPVAPSERGEYPCDGVADGSQYGVVYLVLGKHSERAVHYSEVSGEPNQYGGEQYYRAGLLYEAPAALPHAPEYV